MATSTSTSTSSSSSSSSTSSSSTTTAPLSRHSLGNIVEDPLKGEMKTILLWGDIQ